MPIVSAALITQLSQWLDHINGLTSCRANLNGCLSNKGGCGEMSAAAFAFIMQSKPDHYLQSSLLKSDTLPHLDIKTSAQNTPPAANQIPAAAAKLLQDKAQEVMRNITDWATRRNQPQSVSHSR